jgi:Tfp pilus assembly protein PilX
MRRTSERGSSLALVMVVLVFTTLLAIMALNSASTDAELAYGGRAADSALYLAEAGVAWGLNELRNSATFNIEGLSGNYTSILAYGTLTTVASGPLAGWKELPSSPVSFGGGTFRVAVKDDEDGDSNSFADTNGRILVRSLGEIGTTRRLVEAAIGEP